MVQNSTPHSWPVPESFTRRRFLKDSVLLAATLPLAGRAAQSSATKLPLGPISDSAGRIIAVDPAFTQLIDPTASIDRVQTGSRWSEGPAWNGTDRSLVWSDVPNSRQWKWDEATGEVTEFRYPTGRTNGSTFDAHDRMISCEQDEHRVVRHEPDGALTVLADRYQGVRFNSPNDVVVHPDGSIWFTDPGYGGPRPLPQKEAIYRIDGLSGALSQVDNQLAKPNGLCFSPDFDRLYVADTGLGGGGNNRLFVFDVEEDARLSHLREFARISFNDLAAGPDGQQVDEAGNLWASSGHGVEGVNGVHVFSPTGALRGVILLPETCANVCFGGSDRDQLFMTATTSLYRVATRTQAAHGS